MSEKINNLQRLVGDFRSGHIRNIHPGVTNDIALYNKMFGTNYGAMNLIAPKSNMGKLTNGYQLKCDHPTSCLCSKDWSCEDAIDYLTF